MKYKDKAKAKQNKSIIFEAEGECPPPGPPVAGKQLADVLAGLSQEDLKEVFVHYPPSLLQTVSSFGDPGQTSLLGSRSPWVFQKVLRLPPTAPAAISSPPFVGSSIEAPVLSSTGASLTVKSLTPCVAGSGYLASYIRVRVELVLGCFLMLLLRRLKGVQLCECLFLVLRLPCAARICMVLVDP